MKPVALRRKEGQPKIFPYLPRSRAKGELSEDFAKASSHYRRANGVYWSGLDFHALRH